MAKAQQKLALLIASCLLSFTAGSATAADVTTAKAESKIIIKKLDRNELSSDEIITKIKQSLQAQGIDPASIGIDLDNLSPGERKVVIMRTDKGDPCIKALRFSPRITSLCRCEQRAASEKAARCVLNYLLSKSSRHLVATSRDTRPCTRTVNHPTARLGIPRIL